MNKKPTVAIIDDSLLVRNILSDALTKKDEVQVIATGKTGMDCIDLAGKLKPDFIVLDIEMPIMDGLTALAEIKKLKLPSHVIMLSVLTQHGADATFKALELGAVDFIPKPSSGNQFSPEDIAAVLSAKIKGFSDSRLPSIETLVRPERTERQLNKSFQKPIKVEAIGIGTSTGGPKALQTVFASIPEDFAKPIFVVQHMPAGFTKAFADRLNSLSKIQVKEAEDGDIVQSGTAYIAPGDYQMKVVTKGKDHVIELTHAGQVNGHRPSIEVLFDSLVDAYGGDHLLSMIMTGMGKDGSHAINNIHAKGGITLAQNEATSVVYGMNRVAVELGGIDFVLPVDELVPKMIELLKSRGN